MKKIIITKLEDDKLLPYLKENSNYIKDLLRHPEYYDTFKNIIKEKYHLRLSDKISEAIDNIEWISAILENLN